MDPAPGETCSGAGSVLLGDETAVDTGVVAGLLAGLLGAEVAVVTFGLAEVLGDGVGLPQMEPPGLACFLPLGLAVAVAVAFAVGPVLDVGVAESVGFALLLVLSDGLGLPLSEGPTAGLVSGLGNGLDGLTVGDAVAGGLAVADVVAGEAADDCGQDEIGVGRWFLAAAGGTDPAPPAAAWPPGPAAAGLVTLVELWPSKAADTDESSA